MRSAARVLAGIVSAEHLPELGDDEVREEVRYRLSQVGCDLIYSQHFDSWTASFTRGAPESATIESPGLLNSADLAVLAVCWLHLRFLPAENSRLPVDEDALFASEEPQEIPLEESEVASSIPALLQDDSRHLRGEAEEGKVPHPARGKAVGWPHDGH